MWGTTSSAGNYGAGTVFELQRSGAVWEFSTVYEFTGGADGGQPVYGTLIFDQSGNVYGTTLSGGNSACKCGVVFDLVLVNGSWQENPIYAFTGKADGEYPRAGLAFDRTGRLYGTTSGNGSAKYGNIFRLANSDGQWNFNVVYTFDFVHGAYPLGGIAIGQGDTLYGSTNSGGGIGEGIAYEIAP